MVGLLGLVAGWSVGSPLLAVGPFLILMAWRHWRSAAHEMAGRRASASHTVGVVDDLIQQLKAGRSLAEALRAAAIVERRPPPGPGRASGSVGPLAPVLARLRAALDAGTGLETALRRAAGWAPPGARADPGLALTLNTLLVLVQRGGPALPALERLSDTLRSGLAVDDEARVQASQATASALALAGLPLLFIVGLALLDRRLARLYLFQPLGTACLVIAGSLSYAGWWWMHRIISARPAAARAAPSASASLAVAAVSMPMARRVLALVALGPVLALAITAPVGAVVALALAAVGYQLQRRARSGDRALALLDAAPPALDLCAVVLGAGGTIADALAALATSGPSPIRPAAVAARERAAAGQHLDQALRWLRDELGPGLQPLTGSLLVAQEQGGPMGLTLSRLASEASAGRRRLGEIRARRLPVLLLIPLVTCALPAVLIGAVVPLAIAAIGQLQV